MPPHLYHQYNVRGRHVFACVAVPTIVALRDANVLETLSLLPASSSLKINALIASTKANSGHFETALKILQQLNWLTLDSEGTTIVGGLAAGCLALAKLIPLNLSSLLSQTPKGILDSKNASILKQWVR